MMRARAEKFLWTFEFRVGSNFWKIRNFQKYLVFGFQSLQSYDVFIQSKYYEISFLKFQKQMKSFFDSLRRNLNYIKFIFAWVFFSLFDKFSMTSFGFVGEPKWEVRLSTKKQKKKKAFCNWFYLVLFSLVNLWSNLLKYSSTILLTWFQRYLAHMTHKETQIILKMNWGQEENYFYSSRVVV